MLGFPLLYFNPELPRGRVEAQQAAAAAAAAEALAGTEASHSEDWGLG